MSALILSLKLGSYLRRLYNRVSFYRTSYGSSYPKFDLNYIQKTIVFTDPPMLKIISFLIRILFMKNN